MGRVSIGYPRVPAVPVGFGSEKILEPQFRSGRSCVLEKRTVPVRVGFKCQDPWVPVWNRNRKLYAKIYGLRETIMHLHVNII
jgi:hypothetical protein